MTGSQAASSQAAAGVSGPDLLATVLARLAVDGAAAAPAPPSHPRVESRRVARSQRMSACGDPLDGYCSHCLYHVEHHFVEERVVRPLRCHPDSAGIFVQSVVHL